MAPVHRVILTLAGNVLMTMPDDKARRVWWFCDEFPMLAKAEILIKLCQFGRSKGARVVLVAQDIAQIADIYGREQAKTLQSLCGNVIIGRTGASETARLLSEIIGTKVSKTKHTTTQADGKQSSNWQREENALIHPAELEKLGKTQDGKGIVALFLGFGGLCLALPWAFVNMPKQREALELRDCFKATPEPTPAPVHTTDQDKVQEISTGDKAGDLAVHAMAGPAIEALPAPVAGVVEALAVLDMAFGDSTPTTATSHRQAFAIARNVAKRKAEVLDLNKTEEQEMEFGNA
jgi:hypothetical protein